MFIHLFVWHIYSQVSRDFKFPVSTFTVTFLVYSKMLLQTPLYSHPALISISASYFRRLAEGLINSVWMMVRIRLLCPGNTARVIKSSCGWRLIVILRGRPGKSGWCHEELVLKQLCVPFCVLLHNSVRDGKTFLFITRGLEHAGNETNSYYVVHLIRENTLLK